MSQTIFLVLAVGVPLAMAVYRSVWGDGQSNRPKF